MTSRNSYCAAASRRRDGFGSIALILAVALAACGGNKTHATAAPDGSPDDGAIDGGASDGSTMDSGFDSGFDAGSTDVDAGDDGGMTDVDAGLDAGVDAGMCAPPPETYTCNPSDPSTCPGGICIVSWCVGQIVDAGWFPTCGNGTCDGCENAQNCPADCAPPPTFTGTKSYDDPKTITVWVHGFTPHKGSDLATTTYGAVKGCSDLGDAVMAYEPSIPCATGESDTRSNQVIGVEYYGALSPDWMTQQDIAEVEAYPYMGGPTGLQRYGLVVAKFIKWRLQVTGADYVNLACHSMGCLLSRYIIENDIEGLASSQMIVRWVSNAGVVAGARLARLYDNPSEQMYAALITNLIATDDFALMNPLYVQQYAASYDHQLYAGNNPLFGGVIIHHIGGTNPNLAVAGGIAPLDLIPNENPGQEPNDGIMFTNDEFFHTQSAAASVQTPNDGPVAATHSYVHIDHMDVPSDESSRMLMIAGLYHRRKVIVTLHSLTLNTDFEYDPNNPIQTFGQSGTAPADVVAQTVVDYNGYTLPTYGKTSTIDSDIIANRSAQLFEQTAGTTVVPDQVIFEAPVFDGQADFHLQATLTETDSYPEFGINENALGTLNDKTIVSYNNAVEPLSDHTITATNSAATAEITVKIIAMY